ncbi:MAG: hypothetical protein JW753_05595 [Dehalococcoidia bacterium]|nr:hypothetical protein [Dehalococcoidia bacterium]
MPARKPQKRDKFIALLREGETSSVIIANKTKTSVAYVNVVKNQLLQELLRSKE